MSCRRLHNTICSKQYCMMLDDIRGYYRRQEEENRRTRQFEEIDQIELYKETLSWIRIFVYVFYKVM